MRNKPLLLLYSAAHCAVDFSCAFFLFRLCSGRPGWVLGLLLYNFCAFAMQMPLGAAADRLNRNGALAAAGCLLVALSPLLPGTLPLCLTAGLGNALFHLGGGLDTLNDSRDKAAPLGVFIAPGALGLTLGTLLGKGRVAPLWAPSLALAALAIGILLLCRAARGSLRSGNAEPCLRCAGRPAALVPLLLVVALRSCMGMGQSFPWRSRWAVSLTLALALGKLLGGFLADRLGPRWASMATLPAAAALYLFSDRALPGLLAVLLFNMTMPVTLWAAARLLPWARGFAFGLMSFGLFLGFLPSCLGWPVLFSGPAFRALTAAASLGLLLLGLRRWDEIC